MSVTNIYKGCLSWNSPRSSRTLHLTLNRGREDLILKFPHQLVSLFCQAERQDSVRQNSCQMRQEAFIDGQKTLGLYCLRKTIIYALVKVTILVVHARHDCI